LLLIELEQRPCQARTGTQDRATTRDFQGKTQTVEIPPLSGLSRMLSLRNSAGQITLLMMHFYNQSRPLGYTLRGPDLLSPHSLSKVANFVPRRIKGLANSPPEILNDKNIGSANLK